MLINPSPTTLLALWLSTVQPAGLAVLGRVGRMDRTRQMDRMDRARQGGQNWAVLGRMDRAPLPTGPTATALILSQE